jgi:lipopolysaccharide/colanic/teichoic acid biosynthesis glycosyltransferase
MDRQQTLHRVRSMEAFSDILTRERSRSDRTGRPVSLLVFEVESLTAEQATDFLRTLTSVVRFTDDIGWFEESRIGVVLPDTPPEGAQVVAGKVREALTTQIVRYRIYVHPCPSVSDDSGDGNASGEGKVKGKDETEELRPFVVPRPPTLKRALDMLGAGIGLVLLAPLFLAIALFIKAVSPGPVFFRQQRVGFLGRPFQMIKFRTMKMNAEVAVHAQHLKSLLTSDCPMLKLDSSEDDRIIRFGNFLRRSCIDELPQLINVWRGEMSLVGPRPCIPYEALEYLPWQTRRFDTMPGMTGLWQVSGKNRTTFKQMVRLDINYLGKRSLSRDLFILFMTVPTVLGFAFKDVKRKLNLGYRVREIRPPRSEKWHDWQERPGAVPRESAR